MRAPRIDATIERRLLINYRIEPESLAAVLPAPFRPAIVEDYGIAGICLIRLADVRPVGVPSPLGLTSENAAHRVAVQWDTPTGSVTGVYIPRRDTSSRVAALVGGRLFPGWLHRARFEVEERDHHFRIQVQSHDGEVAISVRAHRADSVMPDSIFDSLEAASQFFQTAPAGYSQTRRDDVFDGVELSTDGWGMSPLHLDEVASSFFDDRERFPRDAVSLDSAFLTAGLTTRWRPQPNLVASTSPRRVGRHAVQGSTRTP
jgi:hypothetical protein